MDQDPNEFRPGYAITKAVMRPKNLSVTVTYSLYVTGANSVHNQEKKFTFETIEQFNEFVKKLPSRGVAKSWLL